MTVTPNWMNQAAPLEIPEETELPEIIPNSTLQLDGDISCYYSAWVDMPLGACINQLKQHIEMKRLLAGCEIVNVHTTHGTKAGRENYAQVNMYQDTRKKNKDEEKSARVTELRQFLQTYESQTVKPCPQFEVEADDSMNIYQRIEEGLGNYSAIMTKDKDLNMCPGNHFTYDDVEPFVVPDGYGELKKEIIKKPDPKTKTGFRNQTKISGIGTSWFWCQLLQGDGADSIPGLPRVSGELNNRYAPTAAITKAQATLKSPKATAPQKKAALKKIQERKGAQCGATMAYTILKDCKNDQEAFDKCKEAYQSYYGTNEFEFETWRNETLTMTAGKMLAEQAHLLWMLRSWDDNVLKFFKEVLS